MAENVGETAILCLLVHSPNVHSIESWAIQKEEIDDPSRSHSWMSGIQKHGPPHVGFLGAISGSWVRGRTARTTLWDFGKIGGSLICWTTTQAPNTVVAKFHLIPFCLNL